MEEDAKEKKPGCRVSGSAAHAFDKAYADCRTATHKIRGSKTT